MSEWLFTLPAFYAEFAPSTRHSGLIEHLYVLRDGGILTAAGQTLFASPYKELRFTFEGSHSSEPSVALAQPAFGHRERRRPFHGWLIGVRGKPSSLLAASRENEIASAGWPKILAGTVRQCKPSWLDILRVLDQLVDELMERPKPARSHGFDRLLSVTQFEPGVAKLAAHLGLSARTLQRRLRDCSGLSPKQLLAVERFNRVLHTLPTTQAKLSHIAEDLRFADQAHMTREFQRHAGLSPKAFQMMWERSQTHRAVRYFQDASPTTRLILALWAVDNRERGT